MVTEHLIWQAQSGNSMGQKISMQNVEGSIDINEATELALSEMVGFIF